MFTSNIRWGNSFKQCAVSFSTNNRYYVHKRRANPWRSKCPEWPMRCKFVSCMSKNDCQENCITTYCNKNNKLWKQQIHSQSLFYLSFCTEQLIHILLLEIVKIRHGIQPSRFNCNRPASVRADCSCSRSAFKDALSELVSLRCLDKKVWHLKCHSSELLLWKFLDGLSAAALAEACNILLNTVWRSGSLRSAKSKVPHIYDSKVLNSLNVGMKWVSRMK